MLTVTHAKVVATPENMARDFTLAELAVMLCCLWAPDTDKPVNPDKLYGPLLASEWSEIIQAAYDKRQAVLRRRVASC